jgi:hypothetical protein
MRRRVPDQIDDLEARTARGRGERLEVEHT